MERIIALIILSIISLVVAKCPNITYAPCRCDDGNPLNNIVCFGDTYINIKQIFQTISSNLGENDKHFNAFYLFNSAVTELSTDLLHDIVFEEIIIREAKNLTKINQNVFTYTNPYVKHIEIVNTPLELYNADYHIFHELSLMRSLRSVYIQNTNIAYIPDNGFQLLIGAQALLTSIQIINNLNLQTIGNNSFSSLFNLANLTLFVNNLQTLHYYAFNGLTNLTLLDLSRNNLKSLGTHRFYNLTNVRRIDLSHNQIEFVDRHAFAFQNQTTNALYIDLTNNNLNASSFALDAFANIGRPSFLNFTNNDLKYLNKTIFEPLLENGHEVDLQKIFLTCDCNMFWIIQKRSQYIKQVLNAKCIDGYDIFDEFRIDFNSCRAL